MANTKEIQKRMKSIQDTMKITNAMYMISSSKLKKSKKMLSDTEPYFLSTVRFLDIACPHVPQYNNPARGFKSWTYLLILGVLLRFAFAA